MPGCTPATTIPSHDGSSADRAGGSRSIGPSACTSTVEWPVVSSPLSRGTIDDTLGRDTPDRFTDGIFGMVIAGRPTLGMVIEGMGIAGIGT